MGIGRKKKVGEKQYPDSVIRFIATVGCLYGLPYRQCIGLVISILKMSGHGGLRLPNYSTICRRLASLSVEVSVGLEIGESLSIAIDSTGLKVFGEGEWKVRRYGFCKRRKWMKLHLVIDVETQEILLVDLTENGKHDADAGAEMLDGKTADISECVADGAYDKFGFRLALGDRMKQVIPPPKNAVATGPDKDGKVAAHLSQRNEALLTISVKGRCEWKKDMGYHRRSRNEVAMYRFKNTFGDKMKTRKIGNQLVEVKMKCAILNKNREIGMPRSIKVA